MEAQVIEVPPVELTPLETLSYDARVSKLNELQAFTFEKKDLPPEAFVYVTDLIRSLRKEKRKATAATKSAKPSVVASPLSDF